MLSRFDGYESNELKNSRWNQEILEAFKKGKDANACIGNRPLLVIAASAGFQHTARLLIAAGAGNALFEDETPLIRFASANQLLALHAALQHEPFKTTINEPNMFGRAALHYAAQYAHLDAVKKLVEAGANINLAFSRKDIAQRFSEDNGAGDVTPLLLACRGDGNPQGKDHTERLEVVRYLLEKDADPSRSGIIAKTLMSPHQAATENGHTEIAKLLESYGAKPAPPGPPIFVFQTPQAALQ